MHAKTKARAAVASFIGAILCSNGSAALTQEPLKFAGSQLEPIKWTELAGWPADDHLAAFAAYLTSCRALRKNPHPSDDRPIQRALWNVCRRALDLHPRDSHSASRRGGWIVDRLFRTHCPRLEPSQFGVPCPGLSPAA